MFFLVTFAGSVPVGVEALPLKLEFTHTRLAEGEDAACIHRRFRRACGEFNTPVTEVDGRLVVEWN